MTLYLVQRHRPVLARLQHPGVLEESITLNIAPAEVTRGEMALTSLDNKPRLMIVDECVDVFNDFDDKRAILGLEGQELADHVMYRLEDALERRGVEDISDDVVFERAYRKRENTDSFGPGASIAEPLHLGFASGPRLIPARQDWT